VTVKTSASSLEIGGLSFSYDDRVLEPRAWTLAQSLWARDLLGEVPEGSVLELCSGAGHIGLLALIGNERSLVMIDLDEAACAFARSNASAAGLSDRVEVRHGRLQDEVHGGEIFPLVIADPPWVPTREVSRFPADPVTAIDGGADGLEPTRACLEVIDRHLAPAGCCVIQVGGPSHVEGIRAWLRSRESVRLVVSETRAFGERGVLVLLRRPEERPC